MQRELRIPDPAKRTRALFAAQAKSEAYGHHHFQEDTRGAWAFRLVLLCLVARGCFRWDERMCQPRTSKRRVPKHPPPALASTASQVTRPWKLPSAAVRYD